MKIQLTEKAIIPAGVALLLTAQQLADRQGLLDDFEGAHVGKFPMEFKAGEVLEIVGDLPKGVIAGVEVVQLGETVETGETGAELTAANNQATKPKK